MNEINMLLDQFTSQLLYVNNYSKVTTTSIKGTFIFLMRSTGICMLDELTRDLVEEWLIKGRMTKNWKASTYISHHKHINTFMNWLVNKWKIEDNFMKYINKPKLESTLPRRLNKEDAGKLLFTARRLKCRYKFESIRNHSLIGLMLFTWLRKSEVLWLQVQDVDLSRMVISVIQGKGKKDRIVPISSRLYAILQEYITERRRLDKKSDYFFVWSQFDEQLTARTINRLVFALKQKTGLDFSSHSLRHTFATLMIDGWCDIYTLSKIMWHSKITTTTIYLACSSNLMLKNIEKHPLN
ncbi:MAG: site-specific tyrosine recombinase XerC [uncultured bacterium (gcode 4)]|uniref:Site-specific tyrosine recombinase XerC n=1 Tax=uncultured bacterium (gcode 4) TaxID=1234023 RepID=K2GY04_9BACT|nr:MAG: site-specific tyrosine recombinase XerC [uncultured bacterium (gcode 4)]